jgi:DNA-binding LacI/PurR family transcriptional regulator
MEDVAQRAGVSRALVSIVFRGVAGASTATRERVMRAAEELAYRPDQRARLLGRNRTGVVGVAFGLHDEFHAEVVEQLYRAVDGTGYELALGAVAPTRDEHRAVQSLLGYRCEVLILIGPALPRLAIEQLAEHLPVVVVARALRSRAVDVVRTDDMAGSRLAVEHLAGLGHQSIAHVDGQRAPGAAERRRGYRAAMAHLGLDPHVRVIPGGLTEQHGERAAAQLLTSPKPTAATAATAATAVTAFNDHCAAGLMAAVRARGVRVPDQLSLVGYDNSHIASLATVALTTIAQDAPALAGKALDLALTRTEHKREHEHEHEHEHEREIVLPPRLVIRQTSAPRTRLIRNP